MIIVIYVYYLKIDNGNDEKRILRNYDFWEEKFKDFSKKNISLFICLFKNIQYLSSIAIKFTFQ